MLLLEYKFLSSRISHFIIKACVEVDRNETRAMLPNSYEAKQGFYAL